MKQVTLCLLIKDNKMLLGHKKRGFGVGKINGFGGKVENGETMEQAAVRELLEETGIKSHEKNLQKVAIVDFYFAGNEDWNQNMHVYLVKEWEGEPTETEEMKPDWHDLEKLPFEKMWADDQHWMPHVLQGYNVEAVFHFHEDGETITNKKIHRV